jgi:hypothetical protein
MSQMKTGKKWLTAVVAGCLAGIPALAAAQYLGQYSANPYAPNSTSNPYGIHGSPYSPGSINNPYGVYGSPYGAQSANNPFTTQAPKLYDRSGEYRGKLSSNPYDADSISNPIGRFGSPYSPLSVNNPNGAGSPYRPDSPNNPYGTGWSIQGSH